MKSANNKLDWMIAEDEKAWQAIQSSLPVGLHTESDTTTQPLNRNELSLTALIITLLLLFAGGWLWQRPAPEKGTTQHLSTSLVQDGQPLTRTIELLDSSARVDKMQRLNDRIMAHVTVNSPEEGTMRAYRETRFYAKNGDQWQRIAPDPTLMGPEKTLKIAHFTILYREEDAGAVYQLAPKLEQLYATLRQDVGLPAVDAGPISAGTTYTIELATERVHPFYAFDYAKSAIIVSSPLLLSAPAETAPETLLYQALIYPLARSLIYRSISKHDNGWRLGFANWPSIVSVVALWELWEDGGPLASGRGEMLHWLYENAGESGAIQQLPDGYDRLCHTYAIWQIKPMDIAIPLTCTGADWKGEPWRPIPALELEWLHQPPRVSNRPELQNGGFPDIVTTVTLLEYIVATYGRDKLPELIEALGEYSTIETLIPALSGVPAADFESGWQAYLAEHY